jgi:hypothetical protein
VQAIKSLKTWESISRRCLTISHVNKNDLLIVDGRQEKNKQTIRDLIKTNMEYVKAGIREEILNE